MYSPVCLAGYTGGWFWLQAVLLGRAMGLLACPLKAQYFLLSAGGYTSLTKQYRQNRKCL
jgi:hypothetical protein